MAISWDASLLMGIPELDEQHRELFAQLDALVDAVRRGSSRDEVGRTLAFLREYVRAHFGREEALMAAVDYPALAAHRAEHAGFERDLEALVAEHARDGASPSLVLRVSRQLSGWLREHVLLSDRAIATHLQGRRSG